MTASRFRILAFALALAFAAIVLAALYARQPARMDGPVPDSGRIADMSAQDTRQADLDQEAAFTRALAQKPDDAETMIRLAALRVVLERDVKETLKLLDRAEKRLPGDRRIKIVRSMAQLPAPDQAAH
ncbi:MAG: hypothetical protein H6865_05385 [Rhodospirillales bacterium]|nr:hypothetical protein [Alphaproteobacteria bacterium]MCB9987052.1 hypothetical protein [Rhodospirillales bacterium]USO08180.1 MAG: hypothetical protein H6866_02905 [Rhodospirillales bacterium]